MSITLLSLLSGGFFQSSEGDSSTVMSQPREQVVQSNRAAQEDAAAEHDASLIQYVTIDFAGEDVDLGLFYCKERRGYGRGERIKPGRISQWTGWTYPELRELGEGDHMIVDRKSRLTKAQRYTLDINPSPAFEKWAQRSD